MKYRTFSILALLALLLVSVVPLAAQNDAADFPLTIEDQLGEEFTFEEAPQRIVCFYSGCLRGLGPLIAGTDITVAWPYEDLGEFADEEYYPGLAEDVVILEDGGDLDPEVIAAFDPDLIVAFSEEDKTTYGMIAPVFAEYAVTSADDVFETFIDYGRIIGMADEAEKVAADVRERFEAYQALVPGDRTFMTIGNEGGGTLWLRTNNSSECFVLDGLAECNWPDPTGGESWSYQATTEAVFNLNPDVIYMANWSSEIDTEVLLEDFVNDPLIAETDAAQNGRIYNVSGYDNPTGQGVMAMKQLLDVYMPLIYPDVFLNGALTDEQVQDILAEQETDNSVSGAGFPVTVIDGDGEELTFNAPPERVVCLDNKCVEDMAFIGVMPYAVGAPNPYNIANDPVNFGEAAANLIQISSNDGGPNFEQVAAAQPDLIVGWSELRPTAEGIAPFFSLIYGDGTLEGAFRDTRALAAILGRSEEVEEKIAAFTERIEAYDRLIPDDTSILLTFVNDDLRQFWLPTPEGFGNCWIELLAECASIEEGEFSTGGYGDYEGLLSLDPDVIVLVDYARNPEAMAETLENLAENPLWQELTAYQNNNIFTSTPTTTFFTSPQGASNALKYLIPRIFPDIFPDGPLTDEQVQDILAEQETSEGASADSFPVTVTDVAGHELTVDSPPEFVVCMWNGCVSIMAYLGIMPDAVTDGVILGRHPDYFGEAFDEVIRIPQEENLPDLETILSLESDLVVGNAEGYLATADFVPSYEQNYITDTLDLFLLDTRNFARLYGMEEETEIRLQALLDRAEAYGIRSGRTKSIYVGFPGDEEGNVWWINGGFVTCGFVQPEGQCTAEYGDQWQEVTVEGLLGIDPDVLVIEDHGGENGEAVRAALTQLEENSLWQELSMVQNAQVHTIDRAVSRPIEPLTLELWLDTVMPLAYPEVFPDGLLTDEQVQEILAEAETE